MILFLPQNSEKICGPSTIIR